MPGPTLTTSNYTWTTQILRIWLNDHNGSPITDRAGVLDQGGGYWFNWGNLNGIAVTSGQFSLFPRFPAYKFRVHLQLHESGQPLCPVVTTGAGIQDFDFQTGQVHELAASRSTRRARGRTFTSPMEPCLVRTCSGSVESVTLVMQVRPCTCPASRSQ